MYAPGSVPSSIPTPEGASTATTIGNRRVRSYSGAAGRSGTAPSRPIEEAMAAGMPRSPPSMPMPVIASISTCAREMIDSAVSNRSPASPAEKSLAQPGIRARGSSTSTLPPARTIAANADSCSDLPTATAVTEAPASARRAAAYRPSPPLSPAPASTTTRASDRSMPSSSSRRAAISATAPAAMRISGTPSSSRGRSRARTVAASYAE